MCLRCVCVCVCDVCVCVCVCGGGGGVVLQLSAYNVCVGVRFVSVSGMLTDVCGHCFVTLPLISNEYM